MITAKVLLNFKRFFKKETKGLSNNDNTIEIIQYKMIVLTLNKKNNSKLLTKSIATALIIPFEIW